MCASKVAVRPGLAGIIDHIDVIEEVKSKLTPILSLLIHQPPQNKIQILTNDELGQLGWLLRELTDEAFAAADGIYAIYRKEVAGER